MFNQMIPLMLAEIFNNKIKYGLFGKTKAKDFRFFFFFLANLVRPSICKKLSKKLKFLHPTSIWRGIFYFPFSFILRIQKIKNKKIFK
jgi:hypothetical protein